MKLEIENINGLTKETTRNCFHCGEKINLGLVHWNLEYPQIQNTYNPNISVMEYTMEVEYKALHTCERKR